MSAHWRDSKLVALGFIAVRQVAIASQECVVVEEARRQIVLAGPVNLRLFYDSLLFIPQSSRSRSYFAATGCY